MNFFSTRQVDELGRIVLPMELRKKLQIEAKTEMDIFEDEEGQIVLRRTTPFCKICGSANALAEIAELHLFICEGCKKSIHDMAV